MTIKRFIAGSAVSIICLLSLFAPVFSQQITIQDTVRVWEAEGTLSVEISLTSVSSSTISVRFTTQNGTALSGSDYMALSDTIRFHPGTLKRQVSINILDDKVEEQDEIFYFSLSQPVGATILNDRAVCVIRNDDYAPVARDDFFTIFEDVSMRLDIVLNDSDQDGNVQNSAIEIVDNPKNGSLSFQNSGASTLVFYTPDLNFFGVDSFTYKLFDGDNFSNLAKVKVDVLSVNDPPEWVQAVPNQSVCFGEVFILNPVLYVRDADDSITNNLLFNFSARVISATNASASDLGVVYNPVEKTLTFLNARANKICTFQIELRATDPLSGASITTFDLSYLPVPVPSIAYSTECFGKATVLEAKPVISGGEVSVWGWDFNGDSVVDERRGRINYRFPNVGYNKIWVFAQSNAGCSVYRVDSVLVFPAFMPKITIDTKNPLLLSAQPAKTYQWYEDGAAIPDSEGGKEPNLTARKKAKYHYLATSEQDCVAYSDTVTIDASGIDVDWLFGLSLFPVPAQQTLNVSFDNDLIGQYDFKLSDLEGRTIKTETALKTGRKHTTALDLESVSAGIYLLEIQINGLKTAKKISLLK